MVEHLHDFIHPVPDGGHVEIVQASAISRYVLHNVHGLHGVSCTCACKRARRGDLSVSSPLEFADHLPMGHMTAELARVVVMISVQALRTCGVDFPAALFRALPVARRTIPGHGKLWSTRASRRA